MAAIFRKPGRQTWWITYYVNGLRVRHSLRTRDERIARLRLKKLEGDLVTGDLVQASRTPLVPFLTAFCEHLSTIRTRKSYKNDLSYLRTVFGPVCDALKPGSTINHGCRATKPITVKDRFAGRHIQVKVLEELTAGIIEGHITQRVKHEGIAPKTANRIREVLHILFTYAIRQHGFRSPDRRFPNPVDAVPRRKEPERHIRFLTLPQIDEQLLVLAERPVIQALVAMYIYAGLRREEALWLTPDDVDLKAGMIRVRQKVVNGESWQPKTRRNRRVPISSTLRSYLEACQPAEDSVWFFPSPTGKRWDPDNFSQDLREINERNGLSWTCLDFRHSFGSHLAQKGESLYKIAELMGNSPEICRRHYAALIPEEMRDTVEFDVRPRVVQPDAEARSA
ncbi:MAG: tyrosine-type recombinase/integrase [Phycisphaerae bacterium]|nr:tyrosine-type recombinase/integrase [Phycisphaerae bacterium]